MKRYWKISIIAVLILVSVGAYYIQASRSKLPQYYIKKQAGDTKEIKRLTLKGEYMFGQGNDPIVISNQKTTYRSELSFMQQFNSAFGMHDDSLKKLQKKYRNFMRGKNSLDSFYEDQQLLAYANVDNSVQSSGTRSFEFNISVLNKKTGNSTSFGYHVPDHSKYNTIFVEDVQYFGHELKVVTKNYKNEMGLNQASNEEVHIYTFDIPNKKLLRDENVFSGEKVPANASRQYNLVRPVNPIKPNKYIIYNREHTLPTEKDVPRQHARNIAVYNLEDNSKTDITLPKELVNMKSEMMQDFFDGSNLYLVEDNKAKIRIVSFNVETMKINNEINLPYGIAADYHEINSNVHNGKVYILLKNWDDNKMNEAEIQLLIADLKTGEILYKGSVESKNPNKNYVQYLQLYEIKVI